MLFNYITIRKNGKIHLFFYPTDIKDIKIYKDKVIIYEQEGNMFDSTFILYKKDYDLPAWNYFLNQLNRTFKL
jgi:hypothetical protein